MVVALESLPSLNAEQLRELVQELITKITQQSQQHAVIVAQRDSDILYRQAKIDKLTHELATLKRWKFGRSSEQLNGTQISLIEETIEADIAAIELELQALVPAAKIPTQPRQTPKRAALPAGLPRVDIHHEPDSTTCGCGCQLKRIGQDVSEKLDYTPGVFTVEQHIRGKWACAQCETLIQAPVSAGLSQLKILCRTFLNWWQFRGIGNGRTSAGEISRAFWENERSPCRAHKAVSTGGNSFCAVVRLDLRGRELARLCHVWAGKTRFSARVFPFLCRYSL